jgi:CO/xanthine dehydrogenase Mo-binding subunit
VNDETLWGPALEPERYELQAAGDGPFESTRREFFRAVGGGLLVLYLLREAQAFQESGGRRRGPGRAAPREIGAWLHIAETNAVTAFTGKAEVGQNIRTSLTQAVADELRVPISSVRLVMGDTELTPYDVGTFGSRTTPTMSAQLRKAAAAARDRLIELAAEHWKTDRRTIVVAGGELTNRATGRILGFG